MARDVVAAVLVTKSDGKEERFVLRDQEELRIGREETNDILISESGVSRFHATLAASTSGLVLSDLASLNGTFVNGVKLSGMRDIGSHDSIQIGGSRIRVELTSDEVAGDVRSSRARAMTAQMKPISVSVLVLRLDAGQLEGGLDKATLTGWIDSVKEIITDFDGVIDKKIGNIIVALWLGDDAKNQALRSIRTFQRAKEHSGMEIPAAKLVGAVASGIGLRGAPGASTSATEYNIVGDPVNAAFSIIELHSEVDQTVLIDRQTGEHIKSAVDLLPLGKVGEYAEDLFTLSL